MKFCIYEIADITTPTHDSGLTIWKFEVSEVDEQELKNELLRNDIWLQFQTPLRQYIRPLSQSPIFDRFVTEFNSFKSQILDAVYKHDKLFPLMWPKGIDYYKQHASMGSQVFKDLPGFRMGPHIDNRHIMIQVILNLTDNPASTGFYKANRKDKIYNGPTESLCGAFFVNSSNTIHDIAGITKDRFIIYSVITIG